MPQNELPSLSTSLLNNVQQMQPDAWQRLVETFGPIVYRWCRSAGVSAADSPDLVQDVFASLAKGIGDFERQKTVGSFRSWLATVTRNRIRDYYRRDLVKNPQAKGGTEFLDVMHNVPDHLDASLSAISQVDLERHLPRRILDLVQNEIEPRTWQAFWMTTVDSLAPAEVAEQLQMSLASVYQARSRVLRRVRRRLEELP